MTPKISVVIPSYNKVKFIAKTLDSVISQKYPSLEVIIQDGASTDGTVDIIRKYAVKYPDIVTFESKKDGGQLNAVKIGLKKATGDVLSFINADDQYLEGTLSSIASAYVSNPDSLWIAGGGIVVDSNDNEIAKPVTLYKKILQNMNYYPLLLTTNYLMQPSVFLTKQAYKKYGPFTGTPNFVMEYDMWLKLGRVKMPVLIDKTLTKFRIEPTTKTKTLFKDLLTEDEKIVKRYTKNRMIIFVHRLNNLARTVIGRFV